MLSPPSFVIRLQLVKILMTGRWWVLLMRPAQGVSSLPLQSCLAAGSYRSGADHAVGQYLIPLLGAAILPRPLIDLHIGRHTDKAAFTVFGQSISLLTKGNDAQPEGSLSVICRITGQHYRQAGHSHVRTFSGCSGLRVGHQPAYAEI